MPVEDHDSSKHLPETKENQMSEAIDIENNELQARQENNFAPQQTIT
jgi:hypothetical protein